MDLNNRAGGKADLASLRTLLPVMHRHRRQVRWISLLSGLSASATIIMFFLVGRAVGALSQGSSATGRLVVLTIGIAVSGLGGALAGHLQNRLAAQAAAEVTLDLQAQTFDRRVADSLVNVTANPAGRIVNSILHDLPLVPAFLLNAVGSLSGAATTLLAVVVAVGYVDVRLLGILAPLLLLLYPFRAIERRMREAAVRKIQSMAGLHIFLEQRLGLAGVKFARNLELTDSVRSQFDARAGLLETATADVQRALSLSNALTTAAHACFLALIVLLSAATSVHGHQQAAGVVAVVLCTPLLIRILQTWSTVGYWLSTAAAIIESQGLKSASPAPDLPGRGGGSVVPIGSARAGSDHPEVVQVRDLRYRYDLTRMGAAGAEALKGISLVVDAGEFIAVVGPVGCGKSTLGLALAGLVRPTAGEVSIASDRVDALRKVVLVDHQDILFGTTIADNLRMVDPSLSLKRMVEICDAVGVHQYVAGFPQGYRTIIGERGMRLSSGQRQLLAIARAVAARPAVLVLDEATSCLDSEAEALAIAGIRRELDGPLVLVAHRMSSALLADRLIVMENGAVVAQGTHDELSATSELYRRYHALQGI